MGDLSKRCRERMVLLRKEQNKTQTGLAKHIGVRQQQVHNYEAGNSAIDLDLVEQIADFLGVPVMALLEAEVTPAQAEIIARIREAPPELVQTFRAILQPLVSAYKKQPGSPEVNASGPIATIVRSLPSDLNESELALLMSNISSLHEMRLRRKRPAEFPTINKKRRG